MAVGDQVRFQHLEVSAKLTAQVVHVAVSAADSLGLWIVRHVRPVPLQRRNHALVMIVLIHVLPAYLHGRKRPHHLVPRVRVPLAVLQRRTQVVDHLAYVRVQAVDVDALQRIHTHRVGVRALPAVTLGDRPGESAVHELIAALDPYQGRMAIPGRREAGIQRIAGRQSFPVKPAVPVAVRVFTFSRSVLSVDHRPRHAGQLPVPVPVFALVLRFLSAQVLRSTSGMLNTRACQHASTYLVHVGGAGASCGGTQHR